MTRLRLLGPAAALAIAAAAAGHGAAEAPARAPAAATAESPAVSQGRALLSAAAGLGDEAFGKTAVALFPASDVGAAVWAARRRVLARLKLHAVLSATTTRAELLAYDGTADLWSKITVNVAETAPFAITAFDLGPGQRPPDVPGPSRLTPEALKAAVAEKLGEAAGADLFSGAALIARVGEPPLLEEAVGLADRKTGVKATPETQFRFGSMGKMFTEIAIFQLEASGKLDLGAPIGRYLKDYPNQAFAGTVTAAELLTHSGGAGDIFGPDFMANRLKLKDLKDYVALYGARAPEFPPGARTAYSNYGFILLGRIIEEVSGLSYDDYLEANVFAPAAMRSSGMRPESEVLPRRALAYTSAGGPLASAADTLPYRGASAGGGYATVGDMARFANALMAGRLLPKAAYAHLTTGGVTTADGVFHPFDFTGKDPAGRRFLGHGGGAPGMNGELRIYPDQGFIVVVLANRDPPAAQRLAAFIADRLP
jgi:CubicO group peptidase (beta-lactamase class C family)